MSELLRIKFVETIRQRADLEFGGKMQQAFARRSLGSPGQELLR